MANFELRICKEIKSSREQSNNYRIISTWHLHVSKVKWRRKGGGEKEKTKGKKNIQQFRSINSVEKRGDKRRTTRFPGEVDPSVKSKTTNSRRYTVPYKYKPRNPCPAWRFLYIKIVKLANTWPSVKCFLTKRSWFYRGPLNGNIPFPGSKLPSFLPSSSVDATYMKRVSEKGVA